MNTEIKSKGSAGGVPIYCAFDQVVEVGQVKPNPRNPNTHPTDQIELLAKIIQAQGWRAPVTVSTRSGLVVRGHGRLMAAIHAGLSHVPVDYQHYDNEESEAADLLADNRIAELSEIDNKMLAELFADIDLNEIDADLTGFTTDEIDKLTAAFAYADADPDEFGEDFELSDAETPQFRSMAFQMTEDQYKDVTAAFEKIKRNLDPDEGAGNENAKCLHKVVMEWDALKKSS